MRLLCAALLLLAGVSAAAADIRINQSRYQNGKLIISGETTPESTVTLDNKYKIKSDASGFFKFTEHYKPFTCMSDIRSGGYDYSAVIAGCLDSDSGGQAAPAQPMPIKKASAKPRH
jgi:hypothetical protein